ncbi:MAG: ankyrin repeat domain-containing protein [Deltaproteobacteria bacterium]|nr:ankyrin repeat domain-containing protein [Deltaproteobacteria bacterium]
MTLRWAGQPDEPVILYVEAPSLSPSAEGDEWACRCGIEGKDLREQMVVYGVDAMQAMELALGWLHHACVLLRKEGRGELFWPDEESDGDEDGIYDDSERATAWQSLRSLAAYDELDRRDRWGDSLLHDAAAVGERGLVKLLLSAGADIDAKNGAGLTPFDLAVKRGQAEVVDLLR